ncbi:glycosyltransferase family 39 protein, partial [Candidatus Bathyarchaeota archaeon]|nr:glycosyltransferase family 39 protein [Candidatus Bathyarchaeota archaeon]
MKFQVRQVLLMFFLSAVTILYSLPLLGVPMNLMDEGWTLLASQMILRGSIIYRDLFIHYTPGTFYVLAFVFQLLGQTVYASRILMLVFNISSILILYGIARRLCSIPYSILACLLHVTYVFPIQISPTWLALTWSFAAIFLFTKYVKIRRWHILFSSGFLTGLTTMFKQNIGAYVFSTILTFLIIELIVSILNRKPFTSGALRRLISVYVRNFLIIVIGICISVFPVVLYFYFNHSVSQFMYDNIFWLSKQLGASLFPPLPSRAMGITGMLFYLSIVILSIAVLRLLFKYIRSREINDFFLLYALFCLFMLLHVYPRYDLPHLVPALGPSFVLGSYHLQCLSGFGKREGRPLKILVRSGSLALIAIIVCFAIAPAALGSIGRTGVFYQEQSLRNVTSSEDRVVYDVVDYIKSHAGVDERILVVPNSPMIYFLTGRAPPTEHALLHQWILTPEIESDISKAVESGKVKYVIFVGDSATTKHGIAEYYWYSRLFQSIISHYQIEKTFSNFYILSKSATDYSGLM